MSNPLTKREARELAEELTRYYQRVTVPADARVRREGRNGRTLVDAVIEIKDAELGDAPAEGEAPRKPRRRRRLATRAASEEH